MRASICGTYEARPARRLESRAVGHLRAPQSGARNMHVGAIQTLSIYEGFL
jgi:hypothetical protein